MLNASNTARVFFVGCGVVVVVVVAVVVCLSAVALDFAANGVVYEHTTTQDDMH